MIRKLTELIDKKYPLREKSTEGFAALKANGMKFVIRSYDAEGLGHVSVMQASGFFGLMKMDTLIINSLEKDMPLLSYDRVYAMGNDTLIFEVYNTFVNEMALSETTAAKNSGKDLPYHEVGSHWYDNIKLPISLSKKGKKKETPAFDELTRTYIEAFLKDSEAAASCDPAEKREKASVYVEGLLTHGGPSTDVFKKALGEEKTALLFRKVLFGTAE